MCDYQLQTTSKSKPAKTPTIGPSKQYEIDELKKLLAERDEFIVAKNQIIEENHRTIQELKIELTELHETISSFLYMNKLLKRNLLLFNFIFNRFV